MPELIDKQASMKAICDGCFKSRAVDIELKCRGTCNVIDILQQQPTIEPEVRHGYWYVERKNAMSYGCTRCSNCHSAAALRGQVIAPNEYYCKNCGSKNSVNNEPLFGEQGGADNG